MLTEKDYCDYDTCVALWSMGLIPHPYDNTDMDKVMAIISLYEAQKWFRKEFKILIVPRYREIMEMWDCIIYDENKINIYVTSTFKQYEESLLEGIKKAIDINKQKL